jgi:serine/threonine-protein kinase
MRLGPYRVRSVLGRGSSGTVYRALDTRLEREVALKVLAGPADDEAVARFVQEARAIAKLRHRNVVSIHEVNEYAGLRVIVLELIPGGSLHEKLRGGPLTPRDAATIVRDLALGVEAAHRVGILHRDLKPANVLLDADGTPLLTDFGIALDVCRGSSSSSESGFVSGSPAYMAPEQFDGRLEKLGPWTDIWGLGALLHTALAATPPFGRGRTLDTFKRIRASAPDPVPGIPEPLERIRMKALAKDVRLRYGSAAEMARALDAWLQQAHELALEAKRVPRHVLHYAAVVLVLAFAVLLAAVLGPPH